MSAHRIAIVVLCVSVVAAMRWRTMWNVEELSWARLEWWRKDEENFADPLTRERHLDEIFDEVLIIELFAVAFQQGASLSQCLTHVGSAMGRGELARGLVRVARLLDAGSDWDFAWKSGSEAGARNAGEVDGMIQIKEALEAAWRRGSSPVGQLEALSASLLKEEETAISVDATKLGVRLLMPLGLCFLPAFILIGVIPAVASFAGMG
jgi:pilus assembly protein TadC